jgi:hypothetical protein
MKIETKNNIMHFAVDGLDNWDYKKTVEFINGRVGREITMHIGHRKGHCMCHSINFNTIGRTSHISHFYYPCLYLTAKIESVVDVIPTSKYEDSIDFTIGSQERSLQKTKSIIVEISMNLNINDAIKRAQENKPPSGFIAEKISIEDMDRIFGICNPVFSSKIFFLQEYPKYEDFTMTDRDVSAIFRDEMKAKFIGDKYETKISDYSIDTNFKYHTLLC